MAKPENERERIKAAINEHVQLKASGAPGGGWIFVGLDKAADAIIAQSESGEPWGYGWVWDSCGGASVGNLAVTKTPEPTTHLSNVCARGPITLYAAPHAPAEAQARVEALEAVIDRIHHGYRVNHSSKWVHGVTTALLSGSTPKPARVEIDDAMVERAARSAALIAERKAMQGVSAAMIFASNADYRRALEARVEGSWRDHVETVRPLLTAALGTAPAKDGES